MKKRILFVEDDIPTIDVYGTALKKAGFEVETISFGQEAKERVGLIKVGKALRPDVVLLDLLLPDINGVEVLKEIRSHAETRDILVFILTNHTDQDPDRMGHEVKPDAFLLKTDYTPQKLIAFLKERIDEENGA